MALCVVFRLFGALVLGLAPGFWPGSATAHAVVVAAVPAAGSEITAPLAEVTISFNSRIDHARSLLLLIGPEGQQVALSIAPPGEAPTVLTAPVPVPIPGSPPLASGAWRLRWQVLAIDGHITRGDIPFTVRNR